MADKVEQADIRGLDIDKAVKGFALTNYVFKSLCSVTSTSGDAVRWYQETSADLTATPPQQVSNVSPLSDFPILEASWTRNTSYPRKYAVKGLISMEDIKTADIDVLARSILRLTRAVVKQVDTRIINVITESYSPSNIQTFATTSISGDQWDDTTNGRPIKDLLHAQNLLEQQGYDSSQAEIWLHPVDYRNLLDNLINTRGSSIPQFASDQARSGSLTRVLTVVGMPVRSSVNITQDNALVLIPKTACTWKSVFDTTSRVIEHPGLGVEVRVWEMGEAILTDPNAVVLITDTIS